MNTLPDITDSAAADLLTGAVEGGTNYWAAVSDIVRDDDLNVLSVRYHEQDDDGEYRTPLGSYSTEGVVVTVEDVKKACRRILTESLEYVGPSLIKEVAVLTVSPDDSDWDAGVADEVVQVALFGKVVYG